MMKPLMIRLKMKPTGDGEYSKLAATQRPGFARHPGAGGYQPNGHIFGGWVLGMMDQAGGIVAGRIAQGACATVAIEKMAFIAPILLRDIISVYATLEHRGRTSMGVRVEVIATRERGQQEVKVTEGLFTFVALDEHHKPRPLPKG